MTAMTAALRTRATFLAAASLLAVACGGDGPTPPPAPLQPGTILIVNGPFSAQVGRDVTVQVRILDTSGAPLASVLVRFAAQNGGSAAPAQATTGSDGTATTAWTLGGDLGTQTLSVTAGNVAELVNATALLGDPARIVAISGDGQTSAAQAALANPLVAEVQDEFAHALAGVAVTFTVAPGDGAATPAEATSGADGRVSTTWTVGTIAGSRQLSAQAGGTTAAV
ncbi:MAG: hypothetical protein IH968_10190, partial [Gemmatimonadetes bacterium]|nr:hypothetical protein [Gemmatimonadota bacterium]